jgi:Ser/Thr protein kinase RdoA (MazF antagonist)
MLEPEIVRAVASASAIASALDLTVDDATVLCNLNKLALRLLPDGAPEQLLHGEPHPGNVLDTENGLRFIDLETCCRGPVEFDLAHVPEAVSDRYPNADQALLRDCRILVLAMVAAWRWDPDDQFPNGRQAARLLLGAIREGPPWPTLDDLFPRLVDPEPA